MSSPCGAVGVSDIKKYEERYLLSAGMRKETDLRQAYASILPLVEQPSRYTGGELGTIIKDPTDIRLRFALAFPEVYEIAQSHFGLQVLYNLLNKSSRYSGGTCLCPVAGHGGAAPPAPFTARLP